MLEYVVRLCGATRAHPHVLLGASPRASLSLLQAAKALALQAGRGHLLPDDVKRLALPVLSHRIVLTQDAQMEGVTGESVVRSLLEKVSVR